MPSASPARALPLVALALALAFTPLLAGDLTPPQLTGFDFTPKTIDVTATSVDVTCTIDVTDDLSGVKQASCLFISPNVFQDQSCLAEVPASGNRVVGTFECTITVPRFVDDGTWQVAVTLDDQVGNSASFGTVELLAATFPTELNVTSVPDILAPTLTDLVLTPTAVNVDAATALVGCDVTLADNAAGIVDVACQFLSPSFVGFASCITNVPASGTPTNGTFSCNVPIPRYGEAGDWLVQVQASDDVGNIYISDFLSLILAGLPSTVTVTSTTPDVSGPVVSNLSLNTASVDVSIGSVSVACTVDQGDSPAGTEFAACNFSSPSGMQSAGCLITTPTSGTDQLGTYGCNALIPMFSEPGTWSLTYVTGDKVSNSTLYGPTDLATAGFDSELTVICDAGVLPQPPVDWSTSNSFTWTPIAGATQYNVYRGGIGDPNYGECRNSEDPDLTDTLFADGEVPAPGTGFQYLIGAETIGGEVGLGYGPDGMPRAPLACP